MTEQEIKLMQQRNALLKKQNALLRKQQDLLEKSIAEMNANNNMLLDKLEAHILKNRKYLRHADEYFQDIARIRRGDLDADDIRQEKELDELEANIIKYRRYIKNPDDYLQQIARIRNKG